MRNSETLRSALFEQIEGLQKGTVKPDTAKATAACAMAICKTVDLDLRAQDLLKGSDMKSLPLTHDDAPTPKEPSGPNESIPGQVVELDTAEDHELKNKILLGHKNGLTVGVIANRAQCNVTLVRDVIETYTQITTPDNGPT